MKSSRPGDFLYGELKFLWVQLLYLVTRLFELSISFGWHLIVWAFVYVCIITCNIILVSDCNIMIWYLYILQNAHHSKSSWHPSLYIVTEFLSSWWKLLRLTLSSFQIRSTELLLSIVNMLYNNYISMTSFFFNLKFIPFDSSHFALCKPPPLITTSLFSISRILVFWGLLGFFLIPHVNDII